MCKFVKEEKKLTKGFSSVTVIKDSSADPLFKAKLACFASIAKVTEGVLTKFQSPAPMAPFPYDDITDFSCLTYPVKSATCTLDGTGHMLLAVPPHDT